MFVSQNASSGLGAFHRAKSRALSFSYSSTSTRAPSVIPAKSFFDNLPIAVFGSFPCHPTVLGAGNLDISADLSGAFRRQLRAALGQNTWVALATGAGGDISTRHTRRAQDFIELERLGGLLAERARALLLAGARPIQILPLALGNQSVALELKAPLSGDAVDAAQTSLTARRAELLRTGQTAEARTVETMLQGLAGTGRAHAAAEPHLLAPISVARRSQRSMYTPAIGPTRRNVKALVASVAAVATPERVCSQTSHGKATL